MKIFLNPGHGGADPGAVGPTGLRESYVNLEVCRVLSKYLIALGHQVEMSRKFDYQTIDLDTSANAANEWGADIFVSVHCNAAAASAARGIEVFTTPGLTAADSLAICVLRNLGKAFPHEPLRMDMSDGDPDKEKKLRVLVLTGMPAILVETGFISHAETEEAMRSSAWISLAAGGIGAGIVEWIEARRKA